jgi:hypothetical protein
MSRVRTLLSRFPRFSGPQPHGDGLAPNSAAGEATRRQWLGIVAGAVVGGALATRPGAAAAQTAPSLVDLTSDQTITGTKTHAPTGLEGYFRPFELVNGNPPGAKGPTIQRTPAGGYAAVSWYTGSQYEWSIGQDFNLGGGPAFAAGHAGPNIADLVLANQRDAGGTSSSDIFRIREGAFAALGNAAMPSNSVRLKISSYGTYGTHDPESLKELLTFEIGDVASGVTHLIRAITPSPVFGVTKRGWIAAGRDNPAAPLHAHRPGFATATTGDALRISLDNSTEPGYVAWSQGSGTLDWRLGRTMDGATDLALFRPSGNPATPASPGTQTMLFKRNGDIFVNRSLTVRSDGANTLPLVVRGASGQSNALFSLETSTGLPLSRFDAAGRLVVNRMSPATAAIDANSLAGNQPALHVSGLGDAQTANVIEASTTPAGAAVFFVNKNGKAGFGISSPLSNATISAVVQANLAHPIAVLRRTAGQVSDFLLIQDEGGATMSRIHSGGRWVTRVATPPALSDLADGELALSTDGQGALVVTSRVAGVLRTARVVVT